MTLEAFRAWFLPYLTESTKQFTSQATVIPDKNLQQLIEHTEKLILSDGKRIRPYLCRVMCDQDSNEFASLYAAFELFHTFCLIHDDIIDHGHLRHGVPTLHQFFLAMAQKQGRRGDINHIAEGQAMLVGDLLINFVLHQVNRYEGPNSKKVKDLFTIMANRVILGQMCDIDATTRGSVTERFIKTKMQLKTAEYTFIYPLSIGYALRGENNSKVYSFCHQFGMALGQAFQIQDDLFDIIPNDKATKSSFSDIKEGQHTLLTYFVAKSGNTEQKAALRSVWQQKEVDEATLRSIFYDSGAIDYAQKAIDSYIADAHQSLKAVSLSKTTKEALLDLVTYIANRAH